MLLPHLEMWRHELENNRSFPGEPENSGAFDRQLLKELNDLSNLLETIYFASELSEVQSELAQVLSKGKPVGMGPGNNRCKTCGRNIP